MLLLRLGDLDETRLIIIIIIIVIFVCLFFVRIVLEAVFELVELVYLVDSCALIIVYLQRTVLYLLPLFVLLLRAICYKLVVVVVACFFALFNFNLPFILRLVVIIVIVVVVVIKSVSAIVIETYATTFAVVVYLVVIEAVFGVFCSSFLIQLLVHFVIIVEVLAATDILVVFDEIVYILVDEIIINIIIAIYVIIIKVCLFAVVLCETLFNVEIFR